LQRNTDRLVLGSLFLATVIGYVSCAAAFDPLQTGSALRAETAGLGDPLGRECPLPGNSLSFPAAVDLALCRNPQTRAAWAQALEQAATLGSAESAWLPSVTVTGSDSKVFGQHVDSTGELVNSTQNVGDAAATLSWTLYDFGARTGRIRSARALLDAAGATIRSVVQQTVLAVSQTYYGAIAAQASLEADRATETSTSQSLDVATALRQAGAGALGDMLQAQTAHQQAVLVREQAEAAARVAQGTLATTLGLPAEQPLKLEILNVPAQGAALTNQLPDLMAEAVRQRPELAAARAQVKAAEANVQVALAAGLPQITFSAGRNFSSTTGIPNQNYEQAGLYVTIPIFTGFSTTYSVRQAKAAVEASEENLEQTQLAVSLGVWSAYYNLDSANHQLTTTADLSATAAQNEQVSLGRYQSGVGSILDVLTAQSAAAAARQVRINAEYGWQVARAQLALALGRLASAEPISGAAPIQ
jgi:outer membrane protein